MVFRRLNEKCHFIVVCLVFVLETMVPACIGAVDEYEAAARAFAYKQLQDPNTFSPSPPSEINPYKEMSQEQIQRIQSRARANGSTLHFHLNGVPALFLSNANGRKHAIGKGWYESGRVKYEEQYNEDMLVDGIYFDKSGLKVGEVKEGTGVKFIFARPYEEQGKMLGFAEYKDGAKHGVEIIYRDYEKRIKSRERHYKEGKRHGKGTEWMSTGQKNSEEHYKDGLKHGKYTNWNRYGKIQHTSEYVNGKTTGTYTYYYETGIKSHESSAKEEKKWFPSGKLMVHTVKDGGSVMSGQSFDRLGNENGKVVNGNGSLIEVDISNYRSNSRLLSRLRTYKNGKTYMPGNLPSIVNSSMHYSNENSNIEFKIEFRASYCPDWKGGTVTLLLPDGCSTDSKLEFTVDSSAATKDIDLASVEITLPHPYVKWTGSILADIDGIVKGYKVRYQQAIIQHKAEEKKKPRPRSNRPRKTRAEQTTGRSLKTSKHMPHNAGQLVSVDGKIVDSWRLYMPDLQLKEWALYRSPAMLLMKDGRDEDWKVVRKDFDYRPGGMVVHGADYLLVWGTEATEDISNGIPYHVEKSFDGGKTWSIFEIPKVDFLLSVRKMESIMLISGIRIPKDGIAADMDWYEMKPVMIVSKDGVNFLEQVGSSILDFSRGKIVTKSIAPNGKYKAFISAFDGMDATSYSLSFVKAQDEIPEQIVSVPEISEIVWSADSQILAIKKDDAFIGYYDIKNDIIEDVIAVLHYSRSKRNRDIVLDFDKKIRALLKLNK